MEKMTRTIVRKRVAGRMIEDNYRLQIIDLNPKYELVLASDLKKNGQPKYYRSQHVLSMKQGKQRRHLAKVKADRMHERNCARYDSKVQRASNQREARRERRAARRRR